MTALTPDEAKAVEAAIRSVTAPAGNYDANSPRERVLVAVLERYRVRDGTHTMAMDYAQAYFDGLVSRAAEVAELREALRLLSSDVPSVEIAESLAPIEDPDRRPFPFRGQLTLSQIKHIHDLLALTPKAN